MSVTVLMAVILVMAFLAALLVKRRVGLLILALLAGSVLSELWASRLAPVVADMSGLFMLVAAALTSAGLVVLPPLVLIIKSPPHRSHVLVRVFGALVFAALVVLYLTPSLERVLVFDGLSRTVYDFITAWAAVITTVGLVYAIVDVATTSKHAHVKEKGKKH